MNMSEKTYQKLLSMKKNNKRLSKTQKRNLERALHYKYCDCIKLVRYTQKIQQIMVYAANLFTRIEI